MNQGARDANESRHRRSLEGGISELNEKMDILITLLRNVLSVQPSVEGGQAKTPRNCEICGQLVLSGGVCNCSYVPPAA